MKRKEIIKKITDAGAILVRHGAKHDIYENPVTGKKEQVPRHKELKELTAKSILKNLLN